ncbi:hypothetical protein [Kitasatospora sp. HPMI-4]|uniref:hypothetical protein n=1 Tax=Kitasatospora sp. HPMI-4 TaxID=3448443 RepID=UPI003F1AE439
MIQAGLREPQLGVAAPVAAAYTVAAVAHAKLLIALNEQIDALEEQVSAHFRAHPDAEIHLSMPDISEITGARVLAEFGDDPTRYTSAKAPRTTPAPGRPGVPCHHPRLPGPSEVDTFAQRPRRRASCTDHGGW